MKEMVIGFIFSVVIFTDHNAITSIHKKGKTKIGLMKWSLSLQEFNLEIRHIKQKDNVIADALSRSE